MRAACGYAGALRGQVLVKTVSECVRGAMFNTLALEMDLWADDRHSDETIRQAWLQQVTKLPQYSIVRVECAPCGPPVDCAACDLRAPPVESPSVGVPPA